MKLNYGQVKNVNKNTVADKAIQELESEIKRLMPSGGSISMGTLSVAVSNTNNRIRFSGLSASEIIMKRDRFTNDPIHVDDSTLQAQKYSNRINNHKYSELSKSNDRPPAKEVVVEVGDIVPIKSD